MSKRYYGAEAPRSTGPHPDPLSDVFSFAWMRSGIRPNSMWGPAIKERIASQVDSIRHWKVREGSYDWLPDTKATWFIDPPYANAAGRLYRYRPEDYAELGAWCQSRQGQVIVCENEGAEWLPFQSLGSFKSTEGKHGKAKSREVIFTAAR